MRQREQANSQRQKTKQISPELEGEGEGSYGSMGRVYIWDDEKVLEMDSGSDFTTL